MHNKGILFGIGAYLSWGFFPLYFKALHNVPPLQILFHRVVWSVLFLLLVLLIRRDFRSFRQNIASLRTIAIYTLAALFLAANWLIYIWGVNTGHVVETSLGYFINPLVSVLLGVLLLGERLRSMQWVPVGLAAVGVVYLTLQYGALPWIALALAFTFATYGLLKKIAPLNALHGLTLETAILFIPAFAYLLLADFQGTGAFGHISWSTSLLLAVSGVVTAVPLLLFGSAARSIPLSLVGILQYIAPTGQFTLGVFVFHEPFSAAQLLGFGLIWTALLIYTLEGIFVHRRNARLAIPG